MVSVSIIELLCGQDCWMESRMPMALCLVNCIVMSSPECSMTPVITSSEGLVRGQPRDLAIFVRFSLMYMHQLLLLSLLAAVSTSEQWFQDDE